MKRREVKPAVDYFWMNQIKKHKAVLIPKGEPASNYPDKPIAFETMNFGWILSEIKEDGKRQVLLKY
jgi:hypothetical protein